MNLSDRIRQAREKQGMTQENLAERMDVSRQAVSKWELGGSLPSPENLLLLSTVLEADFSSEEAPPPAAPQRTRRLPAALGLLALLTAVSCICFVLPTRDERPKNCVLTDVYFFDEAGAPLSPGLGDGWNLFSPGQRVLVAVSFQNGRGSEVHTASLFLTPPAPRCSTSGSSWPFRL